MKQCLVVDDSSVIRKVARRILEDMNFEIEEAEDGQQALDACRKTMPDAILLDWNMPVMNGSDVVGMLTIGDVINYRLTELEHEALQLKQLIVG